MKNNITIGITDCSYQYSDIPDVAFYNIRTGSASDTTCGFNVGDKLTIWYREA